MAVHIHTTLEVVAAKRQQFHELMRRIQQIQTEAGWKLHGSFLQRTGRFHTYLHIWELEDYNHYQTGLDYCFAQPDIDAIVAGLAECVISETVNFADRVDYMA
jgi:NIPSNAP